MKAISRVTRANRPQMMPRRDRARPDLQHMTTVSRQVHCNRCYLCFCLVWVIIAYGGGCGVWLMREYSIGCDGSLSCCIPLMNISENKKREFIRENITKLYSNVKQVGNWQLG